jgi:predicted dehydrogenase
MTIDPVEAWDLVGRAQAAGVALHVGHTYPYSRHANYLRAAIRQGDLGDLNLTAAMFASSVHQFYCSQMNPTNRPCPVDHSPLRTAAP